MTAKDPSKFWRLFKTQHNNACPVELSVQFESFNALMGAGRGSAPKRPAVPGVSTHDSGDARLNEHINFDELCSCIKRLKRGKSPGIDGIVADMIKDDGDLVKQNYGCSTACLLVTSLNVCLLSVGVITPVYKSGHKSDMSKYRGITAGSVIAKLFAMIQRLAS